MLSPRPPIIVILGHVDHGKTTLLDYLHQTNVTAGEAGGITQHTRSFQLRSTNHELLTFIDTPGHAAFSQMRYRGSSVADLAILIVAADDGVMPQTLESINFIRQTAVPFLVAITKSDLSAADPQRVKHQLAEAGVLVEGSGGQIPAVSISAKTGRGIPELLEIIHLLASLSPPQSDPEGSLESFVLESRLDSKKGPLAVVIVTNGTLKIGQPLFQTENIGKVKALFDSQGQPVTLALPGTPVEILGLSRVPAVGSLLADKITSPPATSPQTDKTQAEASAARFNIILKTDVAGSLEAVRSSLGPEIQVIYSGTGDVNDSDVLLARSSQSLIVAFNVKVPSGVSKLAEIEKVRILSSNIIYELLDNLNKITSPQSEETILGKGQVLAAFKIGQDRIAGIRCTEGVISKSDTVKLLRGDLPSGTAKIKSLKISKNDVISVKSGTEFGAIFTPYLDFKVGDNIIAIVTHGPTRS